MADARRGKRPSSTSNPQIVRDPTARLAGEIASTARTLVRLHQQLAGAYAALALQLDAEAAGRVVAGGDDAG